MKTFEYEGKTYEMLKRTVRIGDLLLLGAEGNFPSVQKINTESDINHIDGWTGAIVRKEYYILQLLPEPPKVEGNREPTSNMVVHIIDFYGVAGEFPIVETGKVPEGYQYLTDFGLNGKVKVVFLNSEGREEVAVVNHDHIQLSSSRIQEIKQRVRERRE